ncbi:MAG: transcriptional repressor LexA [Roseovarius sp.]|nr:transcriptional repressor LexA [Roseovarius sp.]
MLTRKQFNLLKFIHEQITTTGYSPSYEEMKIASGLKSKSGIHRLIMSLEDRGYIRRNPNHARAIEVTRLPEKLGGESEIEFFSPIPEYPDSEALALPLLGKIAAGVPIEAISHKTRSVSVPIGMIDKAKEHYTLEVQGDSMVDAGINDGDIAIIRKIDTADNGDIVVALVKDEEATLKRFYREDDAIILRSASPSHNPQMYSGDDVQIQGRLVGLLRIYK